MESIWDVWYIVLNILQVITFYLIIKVCYLLLLQMMKLNLLRGWSTSEREISQDSNPDLDTKALTVLVYSLFSLLTFTVKGRYNNVKQKSAPTTATSQTPISTFKNITNGPISPLQIRLPNLKLEIGFSSLFVPNTDSIVSHTKNIIIESEKTELEEPFLISKCN